MGASQASDAGAVPVWRSKFYIMIRIINQEEFEKCLPMLDSPDVECRLLGWELLCGCTDLHRDTLLISNLYVQEFLIRYCISKNDGFRYFDGLTFKKASYSSLIKEFTIQSKVYIGKKKYFKLKYK